ncbi:MAG: DUF547 domain-containing protein [Flavobacterium sp.]|nr:MAG: DUF547 domain-containing protein [Flavobacterium sp.]
MISLGPTQLPGQETNAFFQQANKFLSQNVKGGKVDYKGIHSDPAQLNELMSLAARVKVSPSNKKEYQAFWINAYNLSVIKGITDHYPLNSPLDVNGFFDKTSYMLAGTNITLNEIENEILRKKYKDARFHFVLVCGAMGCPPIIPKAYTPDNLEYLLEQQTIKAINNSSFIKVSENSLVLSEIFKWYKEDFVDDQSTEIDFINKYRKEKITAGAKISYYPYNWRLNAQ